jgi:hypothetical protein
VTFPPVPDGSETGLLVFGCEYQGANDGVHLREAGLRCDVIDNNPNALFKMVPLFPANWRFIEADAFMFLNGALQMRQTWDVVSIDPYGGNDMDAVHRLLPHLRPLARKLLVVGCYAGDGEKHPDAVEFERSPRYSWLAFTTEKG